jgi:hypothetical protein
LVDGQFDVAATEEVQEGVDRADLAQPFAQTVAVVDGTAPCSVSHWSFDGPAMPTTLAPARTANCTQWWRPRPAAPAAATTSPGASRTASTAAYAVVPAT